MSEGGQRPRPRVGTPSARAESAATWSGKASYNSEPTRKSLPLSLAILISVQCSHFFRSDFTDLHNVSHL